MSISSPRIHQDRRPPRLSGLCSRGESARTRGTLLFLIAPPGRRRELGLGFRISPSCPYIDEVASSLVSDNFVVVIALLWFLSDQIQIYTWMDATLRELTDMVRCGDVYKSILREREREREPLPPFLTSTGSVQTPHPRFLIYCNIHLYIFFVGRSQLKEVLPSVRARDTVISFSFVYAHKDGLYAMKEVIKGGLREWI